MRTGRTFDVDQRGILESVNNWMARNLPFISKLVVERPRDPRDLRDPNDPRDLLFDCSHVKSVVVNQQINLVECLTHSVPNLVFGDEERGSAAAVLFNRYL